MTGLCMNMIELFNGYRYPSYAFTEHLIASSLLLLLNSLGINMFILISSLNSLEITSKSGPSISG